MSTAVICEVLRYSIACQSGLIPSQRKDGMQASTVDIIVIIDQAKHGKRSTLPNRGLC